MRRLFIGINFTDEEKEFIEMTQHILKKFCDRGRYTSRQNFHLTLKFLGMIPDESVDKIIEIIDQVTVKDILLRAEHIGFFTKKRGHIAYLGFISQPELTLLAVELNDKLTDAKVVEREAFIYTPHITLCRNARFLVPLVDIAKGAKVKKEIWVTNITLYESINIDGALTYRPLYTRKVR